MLWPFSRRPDDKHLAREFVKQVLLLGDKTMLRIVEMLNKDGLLDISMTDEARFECSAAILGTSLSFLKGHTVIMTCGRGARIESWCKQSIEQDYEITSKAASELIDAIDEYQDVFKEAMQSSTNPFEGISGAMLVRALGPQVFSICLEGTSDLNPFIHEIVGGAMTITVTDALAYWKG